MTDREHSERVSLDIIEVERINDVHLRVKTSAGVMQEIRDFFTFQVPGAKFHPKFKAGIWDGNITLCSPFGVIYVGLLQHLEQFAQDRNYKLVGVEEFFPPQPVGQDQLDEFIERLNLPHKVREYQRTALEVAINERRRLLISPTASGKSLIIHMISRWFLDEEQLRGRVLIVVPTIGLVRQMRADLISYGADEDSIQIIMGGETKTIQRQTQIVVSTWQSIAEMKKDWFAQFSVVIGDEAHTFKAKSLTSIMEKMVNCPVRIGTTGTLDDSKVNKLVLEGLFGPVMQVERTENLMKAGQVAQLKVRAIVLQYTDEERKAVSKMTYQDEIDWIVRDPRRLKFVCDLARSLKGNTLVMFQYVEKHGLELYKLLKAQETPDRPVFLVHGGVSGDEREEIRRLMEHQTNAIIVCSFGTFSTGVNIPNLHNAIAASPSKAMIRLLQSIGRILRLAEGKTQAVWYDIADDLSWKSKRNYTIEHFAERVKIYGRENFDLKIFTRKLT